MLKANFLKLIYSPHFVGLCILFSVLHYFWYPLNITYFISGGLIVLAFFCVLFQNNLNVYLSSQKHALIYSKIAFGLSFLFWIVNGPLKILQLRFHWFDMGSFAIPIINYSSNGSFYNSYMEMPALADHFSPILLLFVPLFKIYPSVLWLYWAKILAHFVAVWLIFRFAQKNGLNDFYLSLILIICVTNKYVCFALNFEFQPSSLALPFVVLAFQTMYYKQYKMMFLWLAILLLFKENLVFVWVAAGVYLLLIEKKFVVGAALILSGFCIGFLISKFIMPSFNNGLLHHEGSISLTEQIPAKINSLFQIYILFGIVIILNPRLILVSLPTLGLVLLGSNQKATMATLHFHYHDIAYIVIAFCAVLAIMNPSKYILSIITRWRYCLIVFFVIVFLTNDYFPSRTFSETNWSESLRLNKDCETAIDFLVKNNFKAVGVQSMLACQFINIPYSTGFRQVNKLEKPVFVVAKNHIENEEEQLELNKLLEKTKNAKVKVFGDLEVYYFQ